MAKSIQVFIVTVQEGENVDYKIVDDSTFTVGRSLDATLAFSDQNISRIHLIVTLKHNKIWVEDQGSANGTFVNDQKIPSQKTISVEPGDKVKLGKSEIYLSFNLLEKCFKKDEIVKSQLPKDEKESLSRVIQGAHAEGQKIVKLAQEGHDKLIKIAEQKAVSIENEMLLKQNEILSTASAQATQIVQDAKRRGVGLINDAQKDAEIKVQEIYSKANEFKKESEDYYKLKLEEAQLKAQEMLKRNETLAHGIVEEARQKASLMREFSQNEMEQLKSKSLIEIEELKNSILKDAQAEKESLLQRTEREALNKMHVLLAESEENAKLEKEKLIAATYREIEKIKMDSESEIDNQKKEISLLQKDIEKLENEIKALDESRKSLKSKLEKEEQEKRKSLDEELRLKEESFEKSLTEKGVDFESRLKKRQEFAERDIASRYNDLELEEERKNNELSEFKGSLKKKEEEFYFHFNREKETKLRELEHQEKSVREQNEKLVKETNAWIEETKSRLQKEWDEREIQLRNFESNKRNETQAWIKAEQKKKENEWQQKTAEITELEEKKNKELSQWLKERQDEFLYKNKDLIDENNLLEVKVKELRVDHSSLERNNSQLRSENDLILKDFNETKEKVDKLKETNIRLLKQQEAVIHETRIVEKKLGEMRYEMGAQQENVALIEKEFEAKKSLFKEQLIMEQQKMQKATQEQVNQMKILELDKLNTMKETMLSDIYKNKETIAKEVHRAIEKEIIGTMPPSQFAQLSENIYQQIVNTFDEHSAATSADLDSDKGQLKKDATLVLSKQKRQRQQFVGGGMLMGMILFFLGDYVYNYVKERQSPVSERIAEQAEQNKKDLIGKKFIPARVPEVKESYVDLVLYTDQFTELYLNQKYHDRWGKAAMDYLLKTWRIEEEKSIKIVAMSHTLVKNLIEKKETIRTDFLEQGLAKMKEIESESANKVVEILGSQVKYESFRKFERKYFREELEKFYLARSSKQQNDGEIDQSSLAK